MASNSQFIIRKESTDYSKLFWGENSGGDGEATPETGTYVAPSTSATALPVENTENPLISGLESTLVYTDKKARDFQNASANLYHKQFSASC